MIKGGLICLITGSLLLSGCQTPNDQGYSQTQTIAEAGLLGLGAGAAGGAVAGGRNGALIGAAIGGVLGVVAGSYVAHEKQKYATIEQRIAGERLIVAQATATAQSQTAASAARLRLVNAQLAELSQTKSDREQARDNATTMLAGLQQQRAELEAHRHDLEARVNNQRDFIADTEREVGGFDPEKSAELAQWKADMPNLEAALVAMSTQISEVSVMESRVQRVRSLCC